MMMVYGPHMSICRRSPGAFPARPSLRFGTSARVPLAGMHVVQVFIRPVRVIPRGRADSLKNMFGQIAGAIMEHVNIDLLAIVANMEKVFSWAQNGQCTLSTLSILHRSTFPPAKLLYRFSSLALSNAQPTRSMEILDASVWSRLLRVAPRWWRRWR